MHSFKRIACTAIRLSEFRNKQRIVAKVMTMVTSKTVNPALSAFAALGFGLLGQIAAAADEVVVNGAEQATEAKAAAAELRAEMARYMRSLNTQLRDKLDRDLKRLSVPTLELEKIELSARVLPTRG